MMYNIYNEEGNYITTIALSGVVKGDFVRLSELKKDLAVKKITHINEGMCELVVGTPSKK